jgi:polysaccharide biosynthesis/export protein
MAGVVLKCRILRIGFAFLGLAVPAFLVGCNDSSPVPGLNGAKATSASGDSARLDELARASAPFIAEGSPGASAYKIGPLDVLEISVFKVPEMTQSVQVADNGIINLPLVGDVQAAGKTAVALEAELRRKLEGTYIRSPSVRVFIKEFNSARVTIDGAVKQPGVQPLKGNQTLLEVISQAGGLDRDLASSEVIIFRTTESGARTAVRVDLSAIRTGALVDPQIQPGDVIIVEDSTMKSAYQNLKYLLPLTSLGRLAFMAI